MPKLGHDDHIITILILGGRGVGKTTLLHRLRQEKFPILHIPTINSCESKFMVKLWNHNFEVEKDIQIKFIDTNGDQFQQSIISTLEHPKHLHSDTIHIHTNEKIKELKSLIERCDGFIFVADVTNMESLRILDDFMAIIVHHFSPHFISELPKCIAINKSDLQHYYPSMINSQVLDSFAINEGFIRWGYIVGSPYLLDFDPTRVNWNNQVSPESLIHSMIRTILIRRYGDKALFPVPNKPMVPI